MLGGMDSDPEVNMAGAGGNDDFSDDDDAGGMPNTGALHTGLPEGISKEVITVAEEEWKSPNNGDEVFVHYVGTL